MTKLTKCVTYSNNFGPQEASPSSGPKPCVPELMGLLHFNQSSGGLLRCNGVSWKPWAPTDEVINLGQMVPETE